MKSKPKLVIMAAGMGSRFGGLKQLYKITNEDECILDFTLYDAYMAGFKDVVFIIRKETKDEFEKAFSNSAGKNLNINYAYQYIDDIPNLGDKKAEFISVRKKPWGTGHALLAAREYIDGPFTILNADDYYGKNAFKMAYDFLTDEAKIGKEYFLIGSILKNTLSDKGSVSRGVCKENEENYLIDIKERKKVFNNNNEIYFLDEEDKKHALTGDEIVSMNFWGFTEKIIPELRERFENFFSENEKDIKTTEYLLPEIAFELIDEGKEKVRVLKSDSKWYGITYKEDVPIVKEAFETMKDKGLYPKNLWQFCAGQ